MISNIKKGDYIVVIRKRNKFYDHVGWVVDAKWDVEAGKFAYTLCFGETDKITKEYITSPSWEIEDIRLAEPHELERMARII